MKPRVLRRAGNWGVLVLGQGTRCGTREMEWVAVFFNKGTKRGTGSTWVDWVIVNVFYKFTFVAFTASRWMRIRLL